MATLPAYPRKSQAGIQDPVSETRRPVSARTVRDPFELRALPQEGVFFYCKRIDNSRLVREPDPRARGACWSAIGAACALVVLLTGALAPSVANRLAGYKIEQLRAEQRRLIDERRMVDLAEAELLSPGRLEKLAKGQNLIPPASGQVVHLDQKPDGAIAMVH